ncbi:hypothetical protein Tco_1119901, partial [Tanacetum coccineum]
TSLDLLLLLWKARIPFEVSKLAEATANKEQQGGDLFTSSLQVGDGGACKILGRLLGDVMEVLEVLGC